MSAIDDMVWPSPDFSRVPYTVFGDQDVFDREMDRIFHGPVWCYLGLEAEMPEPGDYLTTFIGDRSVVVNRAEDGTLHGFINRCAHRGSTIVRDTHGSAKEHVCIYHHWTYDLKGNLIGVPFERGVAGHGGMPQSFRKEDHGLTMIRVESYKGAMFGSVHSEVEPLYDYLDAPIRDYLDRFLAKPIEILGYMRQRMPSNWKLYWENVNDHYHGGLLHQFSTTFGFFRPTQESKTVFDKYGRQWVAYSVYGRIRQIRPPVGGFLLTPSMAKTRPRPSRTSTRASVSTMNPSSSKIRASPSFATKSVTGRGSFCSPYFPAFSSSASPTRSRPGISGPKDPTSSSSTGPISATGMTMPSFAPCASSRPISSALRD